MKRTGMLLSFAIAICLSAAGGAFAQEAYRDGTVWSVSFIKVKPGMFDVYVRDLAGTRKPLMEEAQRQGLIVSSRMLAGDSMGNGDFNLMLLVEYKNWAAFDGLSAKFEALNKSTIGSTEKQQQIMIKRVDMREIIGGKNFQEVHFR